MGDLQRVRAEEGQVDGQEDAGDGVGDEQVTIPSARSRRPAADTAVMTIVNVTAMPYAAASAVDDPKPITMTMVLTISAQFTCGT